MKFPSSHILSSIIIISMSAILGCVATVGPSLSITKVPVKTQDIINLITQGNTGIGSITDSRTLDYNSTAQGLVTPEGDISRIVETTLVDYLKAAGTNINFNAPRIVQADVREWQSAYQGSTTGSLDSKASIYIEVLNQQNKMKIFSGVFHGNRASHFPIVTPEDIKDSLGFAMSQAIEQVIKDSSFQKAISGK
jgi:hypothetical protein